MECPMSDLTGQLTPRFSGSEKGNYRVTEDRSSWSDVGKEFARGGSGEKRNEKV
jgi:hypothetical protein